MPTTKWLGKKDPARPTLAPCPFCRHGFPRGNNRSYPLGCASPSRIRWARKTRSYTSPPGVPFFLAKHLLTICKRRKYRAGCKSTHRVSFLPLLRKGCVGRHRPNQALVQTWSFSARDVIHLSGSVSVSCFSLSVSAPCCFLVRHRRSFFFCDPVLVCVWFFLPCALRSSCPV